MKKAILLFAFALTLGLVAGLVKNSLVEAKKEDHKVYWCHCEYVKKDKEVQCQTLYIDESALAGHERHDRDYAGKCEVEPSVTPTPTEEPKPTPVEVPVNTPTPEPTKEPEPIRNSVAEAPKPASCEAPLYAPTVTYLGQNGHDFTYSWTEVKDGLHTYWIDYGETPDKLPYSVVVQGEKFTMNMEGFTNWMRVAGYDNGCLGPFSEVVN